MTSRWLETFIGSVLEPVDEAAARIVGAEAARADGAVWGGPRKERAVEPREVCPERPPEAARS